MHVTVDCQAKPQLKLTFFSESETAWPIKAKFHYGTSLLMRMKIDIRVLDPVQINKMITINSKKKKKRKKKKKKTLKS